MFSNRQLVKKVVSRVQAAARDTLEALIATRVEQEPQFTDRFIGNLEHRLNGETLAGVRWRVKTLTDRAPGSQEREYGADLLAVLDVEVAGFSVKKGYLAQAKLIEPSDSFPTKEFARLKEQCERMLQYTPDSFVFVYSAQSGISVIPAIEVVGARSCNPHELTSRSIGEFFTDHLDCFVGDHRIRTADTRQLRQLREEYSARDVALIEGRGADASRYPGTAP